MSRTALDGFVIGDVEKDNFLSLRRLVQHTLLKYIGSKAFVSCAYNIFKDYFKCRHDKQPRPIEGLEGIYSLKRLSE